MMLMYTNMLRLARTIRPKTSYTVEEIKKNIQKELRSLHDKISRKQAEPPSEKELEALSVQYYNAYAEQFPDLVEAHAIMLKGGLS